MAIGNLTAKQELIHWINDLKSEDIVSELLLIKEKIAFYERMQKGITGEEARAKSIDFIKSLNWKK